MVRTGAHVGARVKRLGWGAILLTLAMLAGSSSAYAASLPGTASIAKTWRVSRQGNVLQIGYGKDKSVPQFAALHLASSYFRLLNSTNAGWGASVVLLPAVWSKTACSTDYCQGARVVASWKVRGANLGISLDGTIAKLKVHVTVTLRPPTGGALMARVSAVVSGAIILDSDRPWEAFKPVVLSSMHESATVWDSRAAFIGSRARPLPPSGWIIQPPVSGRTFGLQGGTSNWKKNSPTIEVVQSHNCLVTGWVTPSTNPNDDNVGFWCAATRVLPSWSYTLTAKPGSKL